MRTTLLALAFLCLAHDASAQFLRASASALVADEAGNDFDSEETSWTAANSGDTIAHQVVAQTANTLGLPVSEAETRFQAQFGSLKGSVSLATAHSGTGTHSLHGWGTFFPFRNGVGASFNDSILLAGAGEVRLRVTYQLHSILSASTSAGTAEAALDVFAYPLSGSPIAPGPITHTGTGERRTAASFDIVGTAGAQWNIQADLYTFAAISATTIGGHSAFADASQTGSITIEAISGSFSSGSGHDYAPVPEPATWAVLGLGALAMRRRKA